MRGGWTLAAIFVGSVSTSCIRTPQDVEPPGEGGTLTGQVTLRDLATTNFVPAEGIRVHVVGTSRYRFTDGFGRFQIDRLPLGTYALEVEEPSDEGQTTPRSLRLDGIRLQSDGQALGLGEIQLNAPGTLQGTVRLRTSDVPFVAPGTLISVVGTAFRAFTGENGAYTLAGLPEGVFDLIVSRPGFAPARIRGASVLSAVRLTLDPVLLEATDETFMVEVIGRVQQDDGAPADAVTVTMTPPSGTALTTTTDINGAFRLNVPAGVYRVRAEKDDFVAVELDGVFALREGVLGLVPLSLRRPPPEDLDEDGIPDVEDPDIDNDGVINSEDIAPRDPTRGRDSDGDGVPDEEDFDADGDGLDEEEELGPGADGWVTNPFDADTDGDGIDDDDDNCPTFANPDQRDGDGDGRGDACEEQDAFVTEVRPTQAGPGDAVDIIGGGFPSDAGQVAVRFGLGGPAILAERATASTITVRVPTDAETGNVTVYLPRESLVAQQSFCFLPLPELRGFVQATVRPGDLIGVAGRHLSSPSCRLPAAAPIELVLTSASGTVRAPLVGAIGSVIFEEQQLELANFVVPVEATAGPAFVEGADGASSAANVQVDALDVQIQSASPQLLNPGDTLRLLGVGLAPPTGTDLEVVFPPSIVIVVDPQNVRDEEVVVTVPNGFTSGDLILRHAGGQSTWPIDRIADQPAVTRRSPSLIVAGQTEVTIVGSFLQDTVEVRFTGAINNTAAPMLASAGIVEVDAPVGAEPGPIVLVDSAGGVTPVPAVATLTSAGSETTFANSMLAFRRVGPSIELMSFSGRNVTDRRSGLADRGGQPNAPALLDADRERSQRGIAPIAGPRRHYDRRPRLHRGLRWLRRDRSVPSQRRPGRQWRQLLSRLAIHPRRAVRL